MPAAVVRGCMIKPLGSIPEGEPMRMLRMLFGAALLATAALPALAADDIIDAIDQARKAYQAGDMANAKQSLDLASQLIA
jgi:hypothetical protein